ncbi:MAG: S9 family peptidase [Gammaproteobacteria bacterium]|nr:MAG: S9 family peptidase [Gammaproteobacteria bacterium]
MQKTPDCSSEADKLSAEQACAGFRQFAELSVCEGDVFWLASEPDSGQVRLWRAGAAGKAAIDTGPDGVRSRLNGYGGGAFAVLPDFVFWVSDAQALWCLDRRTGQRRLLVPAGGQAWGGLTPDTVRSRLLAVREVDGCQSLVAVTPDDGIATVLHTGEDFYSAPALSADGRQIAWYSWALPDMPWYRTRLWVGELDVAGRLLTSTTIDPPAPGSVQQPSFVGSDLWVLSDHAGWWQPFHIRENGRWCGAQAPNLDHANAPWQLAENHSCHLNTGWARVCYRDGIGELWLENNDGGRRVAVDFTDFRSLTCRDEKLLCIAKSACRLDAIIEVCPVTGNVTVLQGGDVPPVAGHLVLPEPVNVPPEPGFPFPLQGFLYPPVSDHPEPPPIIVVAHGGPTSAAYAAYNPQVQFWCQRGFAVVDVNYTGSTGFGRAYRMALKGRWGRADVEDMDRMIRYLDAGGYCDGSRAFIQGRSSGGYTALMAAVSGGEFCALASLFGVSDPLNLRKATHRFESGYLDWLLGDPGASGENWRSVTPTCLAERIACPAIFFQGLQDPVVVPEQTRQMAAALEAQGKTVEVHVFEDEGHGFRQAQNQASVLRNLLRFYRHHGGMAAD